MAFKARVEEIIEDVRGSYWVVPSLLALAGLLLGLGLVVLDFRIGDDWLGNLEWFYGSRPAGARAMLSTIAGSTITVAGVVFSITLAAVTYASGQFGPRLLSNFMRDRGNQTTLGVFIGTYVYCLVVLRTIRSAEETSADTAGAVRDAFVPHIAMFGGFALAIASTAVLIYFVHHVTDGIHINNVVARIGRSLIDDIRKLKVEDQVEYHAPAPASASSKSVIAATATGYIEAIDIDALSSVARRYDVKVTSLHRQGDFIIRGWPLLEAAPNPQLSEKLTRDFNAAFSFGRQRTAQQDLRFAIDELVEIAARALSPGVNDPFTAFACIDWLSAALSEVSRRTTPRRFLADQDGVVRVELRPLTFEDYVACAFGQLRSYVAADPNAFRHATSALEALAKGISPEHSRLVEAECRQLGELHDAQVKGSPRPDSAEVPRNSNWTKSV